MSPKKHKAHRRKASHIPEKMLPIHFRSRTTLPQIHFAAAHRRILLIHDVSNEKSNQTPFTTRRGKTPWPACRGRTAAWVTASSATAIASLTAEPARRRSAGGNRDGSGSTVGTLACGCPPRKHLQRLGHEFRPGPTARSLHQTRSSFTHTSEQRGWHWTRQSRMKFDSTRRTPAAWLCCRVVSAAAPHHAAEHSSRRAISPCCIASKAIKASTAPAAPAYAGRALGSNCKACCWAENAVDRRIFGQCRWWRAVRAG